MSITAIVERLMALVHPVIGVANLYDTSRRNLLDHVEESQRNGVIREAFGIEDPTAPRGWSIRTYMWYRLGEPDESRHGDLAGYVTHYDHEMRLQGYWEVNDAYRSERDWRQTTDAIKALFEDPTILKDVATSFTFPRTIYERSDTLVNGLYACHDVELRMSVLEVHDRSMHNLYYPH